MKRFGPKPARPHSVQLQAELYGAKWDGYRERPVAKLDLVKLQVDSTRFMAVSKAKRNPCRCPGKCECE